MNLSPTHVHLLLNHFPTIGFLIGTGLFIAALIANSDDLKRAGLVIFACIALLTVPTYVSGNAAQQAIQGSNGVSQALIEAHESAALLALTFIEITGGISWMGLLRYRRIKRLARRHLTAVLVLALVTMALVTRAANIGGEIGHPEIRAVQDTASMDGGIAPRIRAFVMDSTWAWPACETLHFIGLSLLIGVVLLVNLRLLGVTKQLSLHALDRLLPWAILGFGVNLITGIVFFVAKSEQYTRNVSFHWKIALLLLAGVNALYFTVFDKAWTLPAGHEAPPLSKFIAASAMFLWVGVMYFGSMLPFIGNAY